MEKEKQFKQEAYEAPTVEIIDIEVEQNIMSGSGGFDEPDDMSGDIWL